MIDLSCDRDPVERLADEFAARCREGESPSVFEYVAEYPEYAERIEQLFPAVAMMEQLRVEEKCRREALARRARPFDVPDRLGDFEIIREIGRGGMGIVYEAEQQSLARRVAVKVLPPHLFLEDKHLKRFQREAQTAARLRHTGIVPVFGVGEQRGLHYYVMPLVRGVGLDEIIRSLRAAQDAAQPGTPPNDGKATADQDMADVVQALISREFPATGSATGDLRSEMSRAKSEANRWVFAARIGVQAAESLQYAHTQGTLHRDVKPGNLLIDEDGNACLADFGLARAVAVTDPGSAEDVAGTPRYMAPEQRRGFADARSDIYGLGLTLYELLTLRPAFDGRAVNQQASGQKEPRQPVRPRQINRAIPRDLEAIVLKCVAHEPSRRYQTAIALAKDLRHFLENKPIRARRASRLERGWRWCRRNPALATVSALAVLLVVAFVTTALAGHLRTRIAYTETRQALAQADATSGVALEALEGIYLQLSPERVWIPSDSDPAGQACACIGLRSARPATSDELNYIQVQASEETAALLENLLVFYDRLAEQAGDDDQVLLESAIATRRVGDIRQRLGQMDQAKKEYLKAADRFGVLRDLALTNSRVCVELARVHNEIGNVRSAQVEPKAAYQSHLNALGELRSATPTHQRLEEYRYELARTYFLLSCRYVSTSANQRDPGANRPPTRPSGSPFPDKEYRKLAIGLLERLTQENPDAADYRFLLALSFRPRGIVPEPDRGPGNVRGRDRSLEILEALKSEYPQVADYRYELATTYAWVHVGLFPWQGRSIAFSSAESGLRRARDETEWLVGHNPTIPHYARCQALVLAKLAAICSETDRLAEATDLFEQAFQTQADLVDRFPELTAHDRVLLEFFRLRLAAVHLRRDEGSDDQDGPSRARDLLDTCVRNLTALIGKHDLSDDRLASTSLQIAKDALGRLSQE